MNRTLSTIATALITTFVSMGSVVSAQPAPAATATPGNRSTENATMYRATTSSVRLLDR